MPISATSPQTTGDMGIEEAAAEVAPPAVELAAVRKVYTAQASAAVDGIALSIGNGEFFSLLGPSGCGKTTTLRMIAGLEMPSAGTIWLKGRDVSRVPAHRRNVNTVFQSYALFPHMRVGENIAYPLKMKKTPGEQIKRRVAEMLERVDLVGYERRRPHELSGGQRQRVALARALVGAPEVLLLDEPLGALDLKLREAMLVMLKQLQRDLALTFIYVTHDQGEALAMSDRIAVMNQGRVEQVATPVELYARPQTAFVAAFIGKTNLLECASGADGRLTWRGQQLALAEPVESGASVVLSLRPEDIVVGDAARSAANRFVGRVTEILFLGHEHELRIEVGDRVIVARCGAIASVDRDDEIDVGWSDRAMVPLAPSAPQATASGGTT